MEKVINLLVQNLKVDDIHDAVLEKVDLGELKEAEKICGSYSKRKVGAPIFLAGIKVSFLGEARMDKANSRL